MVPFATLPLVDKFRLRSQREPSPWLLSIWIQQSPASRSSSSASSCSWSATRPPSRLMRFCTRRVTNALRITSVLTPTGRRYTIALPHDHSSSKHARLVDTLPEEPPRARGAGDLGPANAESPALRGARFSGITDQRGSARVPMAPRARSGGGVSLGCGGERQRSRTGSAAGVDRARGKPLRSYTQSRVSVRAGQPTPIRRRRSGRRVSCWRWSSIAARCAARDCPPPHPSCGH